jgi:coenzyme F420-reducing hydrogenase gamma subunit
VQYKLKTAVFKFTCCAGCQFQLLFFQDYLLETLELVDFVYFMMGRRKELTEESLDLSLIEGAISTPEEIEKLKWIRQRSHYLVAFGACAAYGGIPSIKDYTPERIIEERTYPEPMHIRSLKVSAVNEYVKVDYYLAGCPVDQNQLLELFRSLVAGKKPELREHPVCVECKLKGNICILLRREGVQESMCLGPVTKAGCEALCPSNMRACYGCWGPMSNPNVKELVRVFKMKGFSDEDIKMRFTEFAGLTREFSEALRYVA